jgi:hypothetical protein
VDYIVIGGVAAVLNGAPISTFDLDIAHSRTEDNVLRLLAALAELGAYYRKKPDQRIRPDQRLLSGPGHHLLMTSAGPLDVIGAVVTGESYEDLLADSASVNLGQDLSVRVLGLRSLIRIKEALGGERGRAVLPILRRTLEEQAGGMA